MADPIVMPTQEQLDQALQSGGMNQQVYAALSRANAAKALQGQAVQVPIPGDVNTEGWPSTSPAPPALPPNMSMTGVPSANNAGDQVAMAASSPPPAPDLRFGTNAGGQVNSGPSAPASTAQAPQAPQGGASPKALTPPPGAAGGAAPGASPVNPALLAMLGQTPKVGPSKVDARFLNQDAAEQAKRQEREDLAIATAKQNSDTMAQQSQTLAEDTHQAALAQLEDSKRDREHLANVQRDAKEASKRLDTELSSMMARGIDPNKYWEDQSTPQKLGAAFAIGLGAFGAQMGHGGENTALKVIQGAIDRNVDAQKTNMQKDIALLKMRGDFNASDTEAAMAFARADRESRQAGWAVAMNDADRRAKALADGSEAKNSYLKFRTSLEQARDADVDQAMQRDYTIRKRGEIASQSAGLSMTKELREKVLASAKSEFEKAEAVGKPITREESYRKGYEAETGRPAGTMGDFAPGIDLSKTSAAGGDARTLRAKAPLDSAIEGLKDAAAIAEKGPVSADNIARLNAALGKAREVLPQAGIPVIGVGGSLNPTSGMHGLTARIAETKKVIEAQRNALNAPTAPEANEPPEKD